MTPHADSPRTHPAPSRRPRRRGRPPRRHVLALGLPLALALGLAVAPASATFPGANGLIAFDADRGEGFENEIYTVRTDGGGLTPLTSGGGNYSPSWSADGKRIVWERAGELAVMNADGSGKENITEASGIELEPNWSPDGGRIVFRRMNTSGPDHLFAIDADGGNEDQLTDEAVGDQEPDWSPDGRKIAFTRANDGGEIWTVDPDGENAAKVSPPAGEAGDGYDDAQASWSPDGSRIAFIRSDEDGSSMDVWVMDADGSDARQLTTGQPYDRKPAWSPDGSRIAFARDSDSDSKIFSVAADGSGTPQPVLDDNDTTYDQSPDWQPTAAPPGDPPGDQNLGGESTQQQQQAPACVVPKLKKVKLGVATQRLAAANCARGKVSRRASRKVRRGRVIRSSPQAGAVLANGAPVTLVVSKGANRRR